MRILDKYIIKYFLLPFFYCLGIFIFLYIIIDLFGHLDEILKHGISLRILREYYLSMIPFIIMQTAPIASLISTIYVLSTMNKYGELTAMRSSGISISRILVPFVYMGLAIAIAIFILSEKILPQAMSTAESIKENYIEKNNKKDDKKTMTNIALYGKNNKLIFIDRLDSHNKVINGITILQQDKKGNISLKISAQEGKWMAEKWVFSNILIYKLNNKGMVLGSPVFFEEKSLDIESPKDLISKGANYEFMGFEELSNYINNFYNASPKIIQRLRVDLHQKIGFPFTSLVVILIGAGFALKINERARRSALMGIGAGLLIGLIYYAVMATFIAIGKSGILPAFISAHLANIIFASVGIFLIKN